MGLIEIERTVSADSYLIFTALTVTAVNDNAADVGNQITLASGALLTLNSDGTFTYDPDEFESLNDDDNGDTAMDSFTYTIGDGNGALDTATVTITISDDDSLFGDGEDESFTGEIDANTFIFAHGNGTDLETDRIGLSEGLSVRDLSFSGNYITILTSTSEALATLTGMDATTLTEAADFNTV